MQLRQYMRGLGAGLFISAVLMGIATSSKGNTLTDEEVKQRALKLGMVEESKMLAQVKTDDNISEDSTAANEEISEKSSTEEVETKSEDSKTEDDKIEDNKTEIYNADDLKTDDIDADEVKGEEADADADVAPTSEIKDIKKADLERETEEQITNEEISVSKDAYELQISKGVSSYNVAKLLYQGGIIDDADAFDDFLCDNKYDSKINSGKFMIPADADYEQIARIITGGR